MRLSPALFFASVAALAGCSSPSSSHPAALPDCTECKPPPSIGGGTTTPGSGGSTGAGGAFAGGTTGTSGFGGATPVDVTGAIVVISDPDMKTAMPYTSSLAIEVGAPGANMPKVTTQTTSANYTLPGVAEESGWWTTRPVVAAAPFLGANVYESVDANQPTIDVPVVDRDVLNTVLLQAGVSIDDNAAQVVVFVVDASGKPLSGVKMQATFSQPMLVLYDDGPGYFLNTQTSVRGTVIFPNAVPDAGGPITYTTSDGKTGSIAMPLLTPKVVTFVLAQVQ